MFPVPWAVLCFFVSTTATAEVEQEELAHQAQHLGDVLSSTEVQAEYNTLRNEVGAKTAKLVGEKATLLAEQQVGGCWFWARQ